MRLFVAALLAAAAFSAAARDTYVDPYVKRDGTYVQGHYRSAPNNNPYDNYSTRGNTNPYTGQKGSQNPYDYR